ncbi:MAG TPA: hypothetical protein VFT80_11330 [Actinomycetota bacterium]|nr:hypothetical protein [Actinomycetota bacterium]
MLAATGEPFISILPLVITVGVIVVQIYLVVMLIRAAHDIREIRNLLTDWYKAYFGYPYDEGGAGSRDATSARYP